MKLTIELVPKTAWYANVRSLVTKKQWDILRKECYKKANHKCEICGGTGKKWPVECHEVWLYDDKNKIQKLERLIALCPNCHTVKHAGLAQIKGKIDLVIKQLMKVNNISKNKAINYINESFEIWADRSKFKWECDISYLNSYK